MIPKEEVIGDQGVHPAAVITPIQPYVSNQVPVAAPVTTAQNRFENGGQEPLAAPVPQPANTDGTGNEFTIVLKKTAGSKLGVDVDHQDGMTLLIDAVTGGLMEAWNVANPDKQVKAGDRIMEVNGCRGEVCQLVDECKKTQELVMKVRRGPS